MTIAALGLLILRTPVAWAQQDSAGHPTFTGAYGGRCVSSNPLLKLTSTEEDCTACACYSVIYKLYNTQTLHPRDISDLVVRRRPVVVGQHY